MLSSIITFLIVLSILILVHELGHFLVARKNNVLVEEFGFGLPPRVWGKKIGETIYSINLLPFGGFVRLHGENGEEGVTVPKRAFVNKSKRVRISVITAGVIMNFLLAIVAFGIVYSFSGIPKNTNKVRVLEVSVGSPAQESGLIVGDVFKTFNGKEISSVEGLLSLIDENKGKRVLLEVERKDGEETVVEKVSPRLREETSEGEGHLGAVISSVEVYYPPFWQRPFVGIYYGFKEAVFWGGAVVEGFANIFVDLFSGTAPKDVAGPVGIFAITSEATTLGILAVINFMGILSVNLAILNIIPFPALDGGRLLFIGIESVFGKKFVSRFESTAHTIGMIVLLILLVAITAKDIKGLIAAGGLSNFIDSVLPQ